MKKRSILLIGASGYVGHAFGALFEKRGISYETLSRSDFDYYNISRLTDYLKETQPGFLINTAGYTGKPNVDACEIHRADCLQGNAVLPGIIAEACSSLGIPWGHVSSGCIYTGSRSDGSGFTEEDVPNFTFRQNNCSFYSGSKALGEEVLEGHDNLYIWRLRIPFDHRDGPRNYLTKLMRYERLLEATNSISQLHEFVQACLSCYEKQVPYGIYNVTNPGSVSTSQVVGLIRESGVCEKDFEFFESEEEFMKLAAKTPRSNCVMNSDKLASVGIRMSPVEEAIGRALKDWQPE